MSQLIMYLVVSFESIVFQICYICALESVQINSLKSDHRTIQKLVGYNLGLLSFEFINFIRAKFFFAGFTFVSLRQCNYFCSLQVLSWVSRLYPLSSCVENISFPLFAYLCLYLPTSVNGLPQTFDNQVTVKCPRTLVGSECC